MDQRRLTEEGTFEPRREGHEGVSHVDIWGEIVSERENSKCKGPEAQVSLRCVRKTRVNLAESGMEDLR